MRRLAPGWAETAIAPLWGERCWFEVPFFRGLFFDTCAELHNVAAANLIGKAQLVVIRRIDLVKGIPLVAVRIFRSRGVITLEKNARRGGHFAKCFAAAGIARPCSNGRCAERAFLSVELGVVIEIGGESALPGKTNGDFLEGP